MTTHRPSDFWKRHITAWKNSGLSQTEYARKHQLSVKTFGYHKIHHLGRDVLPSTSESKRLIPVIIAEAPVNQEQARQQATETGISLILPKGLRIELVVGFDESAFKQVLNLLAVA